MIYERLRSEEREECNYMEAVMTRGRSHIDTGEIAAYAIHFAPNEAQAIVDAFQRKNRQARPSSRSFVSAVYDDLELQKSAHDNVSRAYRTRMFGSHDMRGCLVNTYKRVVVPTFAFPSTTDLVDTVDVKRVVFNLGEGVSVNIDSCVYSDNTVANHVYASAKIRDKESFETMARRLNDVTDTLVECVLNTVKAPTA